MVIRPSAERDAILPQRRSKSVVISGAWRQRIGVERRKIPRGLRNPVRRDAIPRERIAQVEVDAHLADRRGVVNRGRPEIASFLRSGWNGGCDRESLAFAKDFGVGEEKPLVPADRPADRTAEPVGGSHRLGAI